MNSLIIKTSLLAIMLFSYLFAGAQNQVNIGNHLLEEETTSSINYMSAHPNMSIINFKSSENDKFGSIRGWNGAFGLADNDGDWFLSTYANQYATLRVDNNVAMRWYDSGKVLIGRPVDIDVSSDNYKLFVEDGILSESLRVAVSGAEDWADFVFEDNYHLMPLNDVKTYIDKNNHLPNVPSAKQMVEKGLDVLESDAILLRKIEEAYLYILEQEERMLEQQKQIDELKNIVTSLNSK